MGRRRLMNNDNKEILEVEDNLMVVEISEEVEVSVQPDEKHEWLVNTKDVAEGYATTEANIRMTKSRHEDELVEGKHFTIVTNSYAGRPPVKSTMWTKRGIIRLGNFIRTEMGKKFRDWAEDFIIKKSEEEAQPNTPAIPMTYTEALRAHLESVEQLEQANEVIALQAPKVEAYEELIESDGCVNLTYPAKKYGYKNGEFLSFLRHKGWIQKHSRETMTYLPMKVKGWFKDVVSSTGHKNVKVTAEGLIGLKEYMDEYEKFAKPFYKHGQVKL